MTRQPRATANNRHREADMAKSELWATENVLIGGGFHRHPNPETREMVLDLCDDNPAGLMGAISTYANAETTAITIVDGAIHTGRCWLDDGDVDEILLRNET